MVSEIILGNADIVHHNVDSGLFPMRDWVSWTCYDDVLFEVFFFLELGFKIVAHSIAHSLSSTKLSHNASGISAFRLKTVHL